MTVSLNSWVSLGRPKIDPKKGLIAPPAIQGSGAKVEQRVSGVGPVTLVLPEPPTVNTYWRALVVKGRVRVLLSAKGRAYKTTVAGICRKFGVTPHLGPVKLTLIWDRKRKAGDLSNRFKGLEDALIGYAFEDDDQVVEISAKRTDQGTGLVYLTVEAA